MSVRAMIGRMLTRIRIYGCVCFLNLHQQALYTTTDGRGKSLQQIGYPGAHRPRSNRPVSPHGRAFAACVWTFERQLQDTCCCCWKTSLSCPPAASEYEASRMLRKALPIIPLCREELAPSCRGKETTEREEKKENKRGNSKSGGEMT